MPEGKEIRFTHYIGGGPAEQRPPLLLIHGAGGNQLSWPPQLRRLQGWDVYALDLPGHGDSPGPNELTIGGYADRVLDWMRGTELPPAVLIGHSMGAAIVLTMALRSGTAAAGLVLIGVGGMLRVDPEIIRLSSTAASFPEAVDRVIGGSFGPSTPPRLIELTRERIIEAGSGAFSLDFQACDHFDVRDRLSELELPTLVMCGEHDRMTPPKINQRLAESIRGAQWATIPRAGHMVMLEHPEAVAGRIEQFLLQRVGAGKSPAGDD